MYAVIVGAGEVGAYLARILIEEGHDVAIVEHNAKVVQRLEKEVDALVVLGNGASTRALSGAGIAQADLFVAVTNLDEINMFSCLAAKKLGRARTIARVRDRRYLGDTYTLTARDLGIDFTIGAEHAVAQLVGRIYRYPGLSSYDFLADGRLVLIEFPVREDFVGAGRPLSELGMPGPGNLIALQRDQKFLIPRGQTVLNQNDHVFTLTVPERVEDFLEFFHFPSVRLHKLLIIGGGVIGFHVASYLEELGHAITVIESDPERARWVAERLPRSVVLQEDATDIRVIREQVQEGSDSVAVLLKDEEQALLIAMYAKHIGAQQVVCRVDNFDYAPIAYRMGIDGLISPQRALAQTILERIRGGKIARAMMLGDNQVEILEFTIPAQGHPRLTGLPIAQLELPPGCLLGGLLRAGPEQQVLIPRGSDEIRPGDHVIVSAHTSAIRAVEELFA